MKKNIFIKSISTLLVVFITLANFAECQDDDDPEDLVDIWDLLINDSLGGLWLFLLICMGISFVLYLIFGPHLTLNVICCGSTDICHGGSVSTAMTGEAGICAAEVCCEAICNNNNSILVVIIIGVLLAPLLLGLLLCFVLWFVFDSLMCLVLFACLRMCRCPG